MKKIQQQIQLAFSTIEYWIAKQIGNLDLEHQAMQSRVILHTEMRVAREQLVNQHLFTDINRQS